MTNTNKRALHEVFKQLQTVYRNGRMTVRHPSSLTTSKMLTNFYNYSFSYLIGSTQNLQQRPTPPTTRRTRRS